MLDYYYKNILMLKEGFLFQFKFLNLYKFKVHNIRTKIYILLSILIKNNNIN